MTSRDLLRVVFRRWYLILFGALLTVGVLYGAMHRPGVYFTKYFVVVLPPRSDLRPNNIEDPRYELTPMAGVIVTDYNAGKREPLLGSADTTLYGEGLRSGSRVRLPNDGSQWQPIYSKPNIEVQIVAPTAEEVISQSKRISVEITRLLKARQDELGVPQRVRMTALVSPTDPVIAYVWGSRPRTALGIGLVGVTTTTVVVLRFDRWRERRRRGDGRRTVSRSGELTTNAAP